MPALKTHMQQQKEKMCKISPPFHEDKALFLVVWRKNCFLTGGVGVQPSICKEEWDNQLLPVAFWQVCGGVFVLFFPPGHIIAGNLPWGLQLAGRWIAAGSHLPGELGWSHPLLQNSAQSSQRPSGRSLGSHGSAGTLSYPSLREEKAKCNETRRSWCSQCPKSILHPSPYSLQDPCLCWIGILWATLTAKAN